MDIVDESWKAQNKLEDKVRNFGKGKYGRVLKMARKPEMDEYVKILQITSLGLILMGGLGFLIYWIWYELPAHLGWGLLGLF
ncbi:MAG: protein translocase SEC61 complex subunit gamma [Thermoplasmata archaeon]|nr:protein translocase SEC61 complex subunit gamma [Thermoplasmata archaeon]